MVSLIPQQPLLLTLVKLPLEGRWSTAAVWNLYNVLYSVSTQLYISTVTNPYVLILIDGVCLTSYEFDRDHTVV